MEQWRRVKCKLPIEMLCMSPKAMSQPMRPDGNRQLVKALVFHLCLHFVLRTSAWNEAQALPVRKRERWFHISLVIIPDLPPSAPIWPAVPDHSLRVHLAASICLQCPFSCPVSLAFSLVWLCLDFLCLQWCGLYVCYLSCLSVSISCALKPNMTTPVPTDHNVLMSR